MMMLMNGQVKLEKEVNNMSKEKKDDKSLLTDFLLDIDCLDKLDSWTVDFNLFDVLKITDTEIRHSNILAWLLDPNENHGLGDSFLKTFVTKVTAKCDLSKYNAFDILLQDFFTYQVYRESNHMDIVLYSHEEKTAIIIENKIWAGESPHQLNDYLEKSKTEYSDCSHILYVFLTPDGKEASDPENWISFAYDEIITALEGLVKEKNLRSEVKLIIENYISTVRKNIMQEKDEELVRICNAIYNKHRMALRLIFENVNIDKSIESEVICDELKRMANEGKIIYEDNNRWRFFTQSMNDFLPELSEKNSSYGTKWIYQYWFEKTEDRLSIHFEIGGSNVPEETKERQKKLIGAAGKKERDFVYYRLFKKDANLKLDDYEESLRKAVNSLVKSALEFEKSVLEKCVTNND